MIIMYHGISKTKNFTINARHLPANEFEKHLIYYKNNFRVVPLEQLCEMRKQSQASDQHTIALTFDDGYLNNLNVALPLLIKHEIPATFFISSARIEDPDYLHPSDLVDVIATVGTRNVIFGDEIFERIRGQLYNSRTRQNGYQYLMSLGINENKTTISRLRLEHDVDNLLRKLDAEVFELMGSESIMKLRNSSLIAVGSHAHWHVNLSKLDRKELESELRLSKNTLEQYISSSVATLAFPYGIYNRMVIDSSCSTGFQYLIGAGDVASPFSKDVFPRIGILNRAGHAFNMLSINRGFKKFGF
jgi:peptidoglycan/xylan/chitin deacetylase (PgdA/CDA1 family)